MHIVVWKFSFQFLHHFQIWKAKGYKWKREFIIFLVISGEKFVYLFIHHEKNDITENPISLKLDIWYLGEDNEESAIQIYLELSKV